MAECEFPPAANIFPRMLDEDLQDLAKDIQEHGLQIAIALLDGKIIDGRNRYRACTIAGAAPRLQNIETKDPVAYVLPRNLHRRHPDASQRAMVATEGYLLVIRP